MTATSAGSPSQELTDLFVHEGLGELHLFLLTPRVIMLSSLPSLPIYKKIRARDACGNHGK